MIHNIIEPKVRFFLGTFNLKTYYLSLTWILSFIFVEEVIKVNYGEFIPSINRWTSIWIYMIEGRTIVD